MKKEALLYIISIYRHPRYSTRNCGQQTVALYRGLTVCVFKELIVIHKNVIIFAQRARFSVTQDFVYTNYTENEKYHEARSPKIHFKS